MFPRRSSPAPTTVTVAPFGIAQSRNVTVSRADGARNFSFINTGRINCDAKCVCKITCRNKNKIRAAPRKVISHTFRGGACFLLCLLDSSRSAPTYLKQCLVQKELRMDYADHLKITGGTPRSLRDYWDVDEETAMRSAMFPEMSEFEQRRQREIAVSNDTLEWSKRTKNGRSTIQILPDTISDKNPAALQTVPHRSGEVISESEAADVRPKSSDVRRKKGQNCSLTNNKIVVGGSELSAMSNIPRSVSPEIPPPLTVNHDRLWTEERIIGGMIHAAPRRTKGPGRPKTARWYLVKRKALSFEDSIWKPESELTCEKEIETFHKKYGRFTSKTKKILTTEGRRYEEFQQLEREMPPLEVDSEYATNAD